MSLLEPSLFDDLETPSRALHLAGGHSGDSTVHELLLAYFDRLCDAPDAIPRLRRFIIDLAVRGKLVEQDPEDEPASELLLSIEKQVNQNTVRAVSSVANEPFSLPPSWAWSKLSDLAIFSAGRTPSRHDHSLWNTGDYPWLSIADMQDGGIVTETRETISNKARNTIFKSDPVPAGTIVMSFKLTIGKLSRLGVPAYHNEAIISIYPYRAELEDYLFKVLPQFARMGNSKDAIKGATLNRESLSAIPLPIPPLAEQRRIVAKVDELMALCDRLEAAQAERERRRERLNAASLVRLNAPAADPETFRTHAAFHLDHLPRLTFQVEAIPQLRQLVLNLATTGRLSTQNMLGEVPPDSLDELQPSRLYRPSKVNANQKLLIRKESTLQRIPSSWIWVTLGQLASEFRYGTSVKCTYEQVGVPVLRIPNVSSGHLDISDLKYGPLSAREAENLRLQEGDLLMIRSNGSLSIVGRACLVDADAAGFSYAGYLVRVRLDQTRTNPRYVLLALSASAVRSQIEGPIRSAVGLKNVNTSELAALKFPLPPLAEQKRIVAKVDELMDLCDRLEQGLKVSEAKSHSLFESVLQAALSKERAG